MYLIPKIPMACLTRSCSLKAKARIGVGAALVAAALLPPLAGLLEGRLVTHLLCQYPLLVGGGAMIGATLALTRFANWTAPSALLAGALACVFWLIPRWIDAALAGQAVNAAKAACLVILAGMPLGWGWTQAGPVLRGFVWVNAAAMLAVMGWLQLATPIRLCNSYLLSEQRDLGLALLMLAILALIAGMSRAMFGRWGRPIQ